MLKFPAWPPRPILLPPFPRGRTKNLCHRRRACFSQAELDTGYRLACAVFPAFNITVEIPKIGEDDFSALTDFEQVEPLPFAVRMASSGRALRTGEGSTYVGADITAGIGLIPDTLKSKVSLIGNSALGCTVMYLFNNDTEKDLRQITEGAEEFSLPADPYFNEHFITNLDFD